MSVQVYYNTHKRTLSVRQHGKIVDYASHLYLTDARFHVSERGRQRVLTTGHKNVHAFIRGTRQPWSPLPSLPACRLLRVRYDPWTLAHFTLERTGEPITHADHVWIVCTHITIWHGPLPARLVTLLAAHAR